MAITLLAGLSVCLPLSSAAKKKPKAAPAPAAEVGPRKFPFDPKSLAWPGPPNVARIHWLDYFAGAKIDYTPQVSATNSVTSMRISSRCQ